MSFFRDYRRFLTNLCLNGQDIPSYDPKIRYHRMYKDFEYFVNNKWEFDSEWEAWEKTVNITTGKFRGKYRMRVEFHESYPHTPPGVFIKKIGKDQKNKSSHLNLGIQYSKKWERKSICIETPYGGEQSRDKWWKSNMNVDAAIKLALITANDEIDKKIIKIRKLKNYKNTIFGEMEKLNFDRIKFIKFMQTHANINTINESLQWDELAFVFKNVDAGVKRIISRYFIENKLSNNGNKKQNQNSIEKHQ